MKLAISWKIPHKSPPFLRILPWQTCHPLSGHRGCCQHLQLPHQHCSLLLLIHPLPALLWSVSPPATRYSPDEALCPCSQSGAPYLLTGADQGELILPKDSSSSELIPHWPHSLSVAPPLARVQPPVLLLISSQPSFPPPS